MTDRGSRRLPLVVGDGPVDPPSSRGRSGLVSDTPWRYCGPGIGSGGGDLRAVVHREEVTVVDGLALEYAVFPDFDAAAATATGGGYESTWFAVDLVFDDGEALSQSAARDQHGFLVSAFAQGESKSLVVDQWNYKTVDLSRFAGKTIVRVEAVLHSTGHWGGAGGDGSASGWLDGVFLRVVDRPAKALRLTGRVNTIRGTHSSASYSRGNTLPATAVPHGFNFVTPSTDARSTGWVYRYHPDNVPDGGRPGGSALQSLSISHQASVWMGDRGVVQLMPSGESDTPEPAPAARALTFQHTNEHGRPHRYSVAFDCGICAAVAPTSHAALFEFSFPGCTGTVVFDQLTNAGSFTMDGEPGEPFQFTGHTDGSGDEQRMFFVGRANLPAAQTGYLDSDGHPDVCGYARFDRDPTLDSNVDSEVESDAFVVRVVLATSFISLDQARRSLEQEIAPDDDVESVAARAESLWNAKLAVAEVTGASDDELSLLYSSLYRMFLYPNTASENAGTAESPRWQYASFLDTDSALDTGSDRAPTIRDGGVFVNNGFWDTYRTEWPALCLLDPVSAGRMLDGFVEHYRDGGWTPRWSAPGYADCMVGTSSDLVFADAAIKMVPGFDEAEAYDSALRNATSPALHPAVGRKGLTTGIFRGYIDTRTEEGMSWSLENATADYGLHRFADLLAARCDPDDPRRRRYEAESVYFANRALGYRLLFDQEADFFRGRDAAGRFEAPAGGFDPAVWGGDYTETNAWGMAFTAVHDGVGLSSLYGGRAGLEAKLDAFFATPELGGAAVKGSYPNVIHEMTEARNMRMGMFGLSNQPAHHIPFMYSFAGAPGKTQAITREALGRLFTGGEIGQGYPGDEDNGEMSAWYFFAVLGLYPLVLGSGGYVITSPLFDRFVLTLATGKTITVTAHDNSRRNVYVQRLRVNGEPWHSTFISHDLVADGATLEFWMGPEASAWGTSPDAVPPSLTTPDRRHDPVSDLTGATGCVVTSSHGDARIASDDSSAMSLDLPTGGWVAYLLAEPCAVGFYTVTSGPLLTRWTVEGRADTTEWVVVDRRVDEWFQWDRQTRPFVIQDPRPFTQYRLRVGQLDAEVADTVPIAQIELFPCGGGQDRAQTMTIL